MGGAGGRPEAFPAPGDGPFVTGLGSCALARQWFEHDGERVDQAEGCRLAWHDADDAGTAPYLTDDPLPAGRARDPSPVWAREDHAGRHVAAGPFHRGPELRLPLAEHAGDHANRVSAPALASRAKIASGIAAARGPAGASAIIGLIARRPGPAGLRGTSVRNTLQRASTPRPLHDAGNDRVHGR